MNGFVKLQRRFFSHWLWREKREMSRAEAFLDLLQLACYMPTKLVVSGRVMEVPRGCLAASERSLSERWGWSRSKVRRFLCELEADGMVETEKDHPIPVVKLSNYGHWNDDDVEKEPPANHQRTTERPPLYIKKKEENIPTTTTTTSIVAASRPTASSSASPWPDLAEVLAYARSAPVPIGKACATTFLDEMESSGWQRRGMEVRDWRAALRRWATAWNQYAQAGRPGHQNRHRSPHPQPHPQTQTHTGQATDHRAEKARREYPEVKSANSQLPDA